MAQKELSLEWNKSGTAASCGAPVMMAFNKDISYNI